MQESRLHTEHVPRQNTAIIQ